MKSKVIALMLLCVAFSTQAQFGKLKLGGNKKDTTEVKTEDKKEKGGGGFLNKIVSKVAKSVSGLTTTTTADLTAVIPNVFYGTNLHSAAVNSIDQSFYNDWKENGNMVAVMFTTKGAYGMNKIDGEVKINGVPAEYVSTGLYVAFSDDNTSSKIVEVISSNGQKSAFTINPPKQAVKIVSINGQKDNVSLDLTKEVVLELENLSSDDKTPVLISLAINAIGLKSFYQVGYFAPTAKIVIPPAYFRNINIAPGNTKVIGFNYKGSFFQVERSTIDQATDVSGVYPTVEYGNMYYDGKFLTVSTPPEINIGLTAKGTENFANGPVTYELYKPNAYMSRSSDQLKTIGITSFAVRGTTYYYSETTNDALGRTTTKEATFPQFPNEVWDGILEKLYTDLVPIIQSEFNATVLPVEKITSTAAYKSMEAYAKDDVNTKVEFSTAYKDTKVISTFLPISESYGINNADSRLMKESGANALLKVTLDVRLTFEGKNSTMVPVLGIELNGEQNGPTTSTKYFTATITGEGVPYTKNITPKVLEEIIVRKSDLLATFTKGLQELKKQEAANPDYKTIWSVKK
jgi:hypothetical protein